MEETENPGKKLTYDELNNIAVQMQQRAMIAEQKLQNVDLTSMRLHYLFEIIRYSNRDVFTQEFVEKCAKEIEDILTIKEED